MSEETKQPAAMDVKELLRSMYGGENKRITDGNSVTLCRWMVFGGKKVAQAEVVATIVDGEKV